MAHLLGKRKIVLTMLFTVFFFTVQAQHCSQASARTHFNFKLLKKGGLHIDTNRVRIDGVYLFKYYPPEFSKESYSFCRFFDNGRVYISELYCSYPSSQELEELHYGRYGYYRVDDDRVTIETFTGPARYYFMYFTIESANLVTFSIKRRGWKFPKFSEELIGKKAGEFVPHTFKENETFW